ncbi:MAG: CRTAC1 family protein [Puia sp.]|nr:CRTAC1 family protein [Puia sp.]
MNKMIKRILLPAVVLVGVGVGSYTYREKRSERERLNQIYRTGLKPVYDKDNPFTPEAEIAYCDSVIALPAYRESRKKIMRFLKATDFLKLGEIQKAIDLLEVLHQDSSVDLPPRLVKEVRDNLALAYLRLGERNNCVRGHDDASCIFPIRGNGIYKDPYASRKGIALYQDILRLDSNDLESRWLLNIAYMTLGEYPGRVPVQWLIPGLDTDTSSYAVKPFIDRAGPLRLNGFRNMAGGSIVEDFDNDGNLDIVTSNWGLQESMHYFRNNGDGSFIDVSGPSGLDQVRGGLNIVQADYNNDGYADILVLRGAWMQEFGNQPASLLRNNGDGTFTDVTVESGLLSLSPTQTATWADFNNDGWLDLFVGHETASPDHPHPSELFINNHDGTFTNVAREAGCEALAYMKGVTSSDYNNDGWPDIFISTLNGRKILFKNKAVKSRIPQFENATHEAGLDRDVTFTFPAWFWDYDNDGWADIFACGYQFQGSLAGPAAAEALGKQLGADVSRMYLYHNNHDGTFTNVSKKMGLDKPVFAMGSNFGDIDNDGWLDMYLGTGNPDYRSLVPNRLFRNIGGRFFADVTTSARVGNLQKGHGVAFADIDNDGDQDIFIETGGAYPGDAFYNSFYVNPGQNDNKWISVLLEGVQSNRSAIGARIVVSFTEDGAKRTVYRDVNSGGSFGASPLRKEIGVGRTSVIDELIIRWPTTGQVQVFKNVEPCQFLRVREGSDHIEQIHLNKLDFMKQVTTTGIMDCVPGKTAAPANAAPASVAPSSRAPSSAAAGVSTKGAGPR